MNLKNKNVEISIISITMALYVVLGYIFQPINFMQLQFRVAEIMVGMCILFPISGLIGNVLGVFFLNLTSPLGLIDIIFMPLVNILALICIILLRNKKYLKYVGGMLYAFIISLGVGLELFLILGLPFLLMVIQVFIPEIILSSIGILIFTRIKYHIGELVDHTR